VEKANLVDQRIQRMEQFFQRHAERLPRQGAIVASYRQRGAVRLGPYYRLTCRDADGRQRALYLGADALLVDQARSRLAEMQRPQRVQRSLRRARRTVRQHLKAALADWDQQLGAQGQYLKGLEIRGRKLAPRLKSNTTAAAGLLADE
jgi:hypothetical protein